MSSEGGGAHNDVVSHRKEGKTFAAWLHAGEDPGCLVFSRSVVPSALSAAVLIPSLWFLWPSFRQPVLLLVALAAAAMVSLSESRTALILTATALVYRPAWGAPIVVPFDSIARVRETNVRRSFLLRPLLVPGLEVRLFNGGTVQVPADFRGVQRVHQRLQVLGKLTAGTGGGRTGRCF